MRVKPHLNIAKVRELMQARGLRQADIHRLTGLSRGHISQILSGQRPRPSAATVVRLAQALGVSAEELLEGGDEAATRGL